MLNFSDILTNLLELNCNLVALNLLVSLPALVFRVLDLVTGTFGALKQAIIFSESEKMTIDIDGDSSIASSFYQP